jgi:hypothetical protein
LKTVGEDMLKIYQSIIWLFLFCLVSVNPLVAQHHNDKDVFDLYREYSSYTDPGEYAYLYKNLPESLEELCNLIKCQLIHPVDVKQFVDLIPKERYFEDPKFHTIEKLLEGLIELDPNGLTFDRKPEHRLVVTCQLHSLLLASILKSRGIPTRLRYGFAPYLARGKDLHAYHIICQVWDEKEKRWALVDPDRKMVDFPRDEFELAGDVWQQLQNGEIEPKKYGVAQFWGDYMILDVLCHDFVSVLNRELLYLESPPISAGEDMDVGKIEKNKMEVLNQISMLLKNPDRHINELKALHDKYDFLQYKK